MMIKDDPEMENDTSQSSDTEHMCKKPKVSAADDNIGSTSITNSHEKIMSATSTSR